MLTKNDSRLTFPPAVVSRHAVNGRCGLRLSLATLLLLLPIRTAADGFLALPAVDDRLELRAALLPEGWAGALQIAAFWQTAPVEEAEPPVRTMAYLVRDADALYVAFHLEDPRPEEIRAPFGDRDAVRSDQDFVQVEIDAEGSGRSARLYRVNPRGVQTDGVFSEATQQDDLAPDFTFETLTRITPGGWVAAFRIPLVELGMPKRSRGEWRVMLFRNYPRANTYQMASALVPRGFNCWLCHAMPLAGTSGIASRPLLAVTPYLVASRTSPGMPAGGTGAALEGGLDLRWQPSAGTVVEATVNPDFSQVEADAPVLDIGAAFALLYAEKRSFFMEGVELLTTPIPVVYTRSVTAPSFGLRTTGTLGTTSYGVLIARDDGGGSVLIPGPTSSRFVPQNFASTVFLARARWEPKSMFTPGLMLSAREVEGGGYNRVVGPDIQWRPGPSDRIAAQFLLSSTQEFVRPGLDPAFDGKQQASHAFAFSWDHTTKGPGFSLEANEIGAGFRAHNGFVPQVDRRGWSGGAWYRFYPGGWFTQLEPGVAAEHSRDLHGRLLSSALVGRLRFQGKRGLVGALEVHTHERQRTADRVLEVTHAVLTISAQPGRRLPVLDLMLRAGEDVDADNARVGGGASASLNATLRPNDRLELLGRLEHRWLNAAEGPQRARTFSATAARLKSTYAFSVSTLLRFLAQYERVSRDPALYRLPVPRNEGTLGMSLLFTWRPTLRTVVFLGVGDRRLLDEDGSLLPPGRQFFAKASYGL